MPLPNQNMPGSLGSHDSMIEPKQGKTFGLDPNKEMVKPVSAFRFLISGAPKTKSTAENLRAKIAMKKAEKMPAGTKKQPEATSKFNGKTVSFEKIAKDLKNNPEYYSKYKLTNEQRVKYNKLLQERIGNSHFQSYRKEEVEKFIKNLSSKDLPENMKDKNKFGKLLRGTFGLPKK